MIAVLKFAVENALKKDYDVILAAGIFEKILPKHIRDRIVSQVERGAGFVYVSPVSFTFPSLVPKNAGEPFSPPGIPYDALPFDLDCARISRHGKGTVILVQANVDNAGLFWWQETAFRAGDGAVGMMQLIRSCATAVFWI